MENHIYRIQLTEDTNLDFFVSTVGQATKELGLCVFNKNIQLDGDLDLSEIDSLLKFLTDCREYIEKHNKPITDTTNKTQFEKNFDKMIV